MTGRRQWRVEGDDEWLRGHRGETFARMRRRLPGHAGRIFADSVLGGTVFSPKRNPQLRLDSRYTEQVRYAERHYAYTAVNIEIHQCRSCGGRRRVRHRISLVSESGHRTLVGELAGCWRCDADSWLFRSRMPTIVKARLRREKVVL